MRPFTTGFIAVYLALMGITFMVTDAQAEDKLILEVYTGVVSGVEESTETPTQYRLNLGYDWYYAFGTYEAMSFRMIGQEHGTGSLTTVGVGARYTFMPQLQGFVEAGMGIVDYSPKAAIVDEVAFTQLMRHNVDFRPVPFGTCHDAPLCNRGSKLEVDDEVVFRFGLKWEPIKHVNVLLGYRFMQAPVYYAVFDLDRYAEKRGWWEEHTKLNMGAVEFSIGYSW